MEALRVLVELQQRLQECRRKLEETERHMEEDVEERRRLQQVRDVRVAKAKQLKALDERWRGVLEAAAEGVRATALCAGPVEATQRALARARDLVLREAARIVNAQDYAEALEESLATAERQAGLATRALQLQAQTNAGQTGLAALVTEMRALGEERAPSASASSAAAVGATAPAEDDLKDVCFLRPFLVSEEMQRSLRAAQAAMRALGERRQRGQAQGQGQGQEQEEPVEAFAEAAKELDTHYMSTLRPAWDRHSPILPWQRRLQGALRDHGALLLETPVLTEALRTARKALQRAVEERMAAASEAFHALLCELQAAVEGVERAVVEEKRRRREAEAAQRREAEAAARRTREEEAAARERARQEARALARLELLKRRRAFLKEGLRLERAREALKEARAAGALSGVGEGAEAEKEEEEEEEVAGAAEEEVVATSLKGSQVVVVQSRPIADTERWPMAMAEARLPLNLMCQCRQNDVSQDFWEGRVVAAAAAAALEDHAQGAGDQRLRSKVVAAGAARKRPRVLVVDTSAARGELLLSPAGANGSGGPGPASGSGGRKRKKKNKGKGRKKWRGNGVAITPGI